MRHPFFLLFFLFTSLVSIGQTSTLTISTIETIPNPKERDNTYVADPDGFLDAASIQQLNQMARAIDDSTSAEVAIVVVKNIGDEVPKEFANELFNHWGIGKQLSNNGLLIFTSMDNRRTEFEVGYGLEPILTDIVCYRIGTKFIVPNFRQGNYGKGLVEALDAVQTIINDPAAKDEMLEFSIDHSKRSDDFAERFAMAFWLLILGGYILSNIIFGVHRNQKINLIHDAKDDFYDKYNQLETRFSGCMGVFLYFIFPLAGILLYQRINRRMKHYRNAPRYSKVNGKEMFLKSNVDEDAYLMQGQIVEEKLDSVQYDVWVTDDESDILLLRYKGNSRHYKKCKKCNYKTLGKERTEIIKSATTSSTGLKEITYKCKNCNRVEHKTFTIPKISTSSSGSSWSSGSSGGGGSSFGGGSSGGGGAGVSW